MNHPLLESGPAHLERWMREYYFACDHDIGSSGVESFSMKDLREPGFLSAEEIDAVLFNDSPTLGGELLRSAIARRLAGGRVDRVIATHGSSEAIFLIANALIRPGDEVVVMEPCYQQLFVVAHSLGATIKRWRLRWENGFVPDLDEALALIGPRTRMVVANFPHNPTGADLSAEGRRALIAAAARVGAYVLWDGAFEELRYECAVARDLPTDYERYIAIGTLSKAYGFPGLRVGWCIGHPRLLEQCAHLRDYTILHLSPLIELIASRVMDHADDLVGRRRHLARRNRERVDTWIQDHAAHIGWIAPSGGVCGFPRLMRSRDVERLCRRLAQECRTLLVPGACFGEPQHVRLGFGCSSASLECGLERFSSLLCEDRTGAR